MNKNYFVVPKIEISDSEWDRLVSESEDGWLYQTSSWIRFAESCGSQSVSFGVRAKNGALIAVFPLYRQDLKVKKFFKINRLYTGLSGPAISVEVTEKNRRKLWKGMFQHIDDIARKDNIDLLQVRLTTLSPAYLPPIRPEINPLFKVGLTSPLMIGLEDTVQPLTRIIYLDSDQEHLLMDMDTDCRAAVRQGERNGLAFIEGTTIKDLEEYLAIHTRSWQRTGLTPHEYTYFEQMWREFGPQFMRLFFVEHNGKRVAGIIVHMFKRGVFYWGGCSDADFLSLRPNNFLLWNVICWAKNEGFGFFEVGQFYPSPIKDLKEYNVGRYKVQFGTDELVPFEGQKVYKAGKILTLELFKKIKGFIKRRSSQQK